jgi:hypothetical protein
MSAFMLWMNASRESIKKKHPDFGLTEISKKAGEMWKAISSEEKKVIDEILAFVQLIISSENVFRKKNAG